MLSGHVGWGGRRSGREAQPRPIGHMNPKEWKRPIGRFSYDLQLVRILTAIHIVKGHSQPWQQHLCTCSPHL
jgi:hypothetical protein